MLSTAIISNNYEIVGRMLKILSLIRSVTDDRLLYKEASKLQLPLENIRKDNFKLNWHDPMINPNLTLELHDFFKYTHWWEKFFITDFLDYVKHTADYDDPDYDELLSHITSHSIDDIFGEMDDIVLCLDKIMHIDYDKMRKDNRDFFVELNEYLLHPDRIQRMSEQFNIDFGDYLDALDV